MPQQKDELTDTLTSLNAPLAGIDLAVHSFVPTTSGEGAEQVLNLTFSIQNNGDTESGPSLAYLYDGTTLLGSVEVASIAGASVSPIYSFTVNSLTPGKHTLKVTADGEDWIAEVMEINNSKTSSVADKIIKGKTEILHFHLNDRSVSVTSSATKFMSYNLTQTFSVWEAENSEGSITGGGVVLKQAEENGAAVVRAAQDNFTDLIFAKAIGTWSAIYAAKHVGSGTWSGTGEIVSLAGKNQIGDFYFGASTDESVLYLTDDECGDALFLDDAYTELPATVSMQQARILNINAVFAGAGDDVVDLTSQKFAFSSNCIAIHGGEGDDALWANATGAILLGEDGDDRLIGGDSDDFLAGGNGNDSMHGGGGNDTFLFGENWGNDQIEQLAAGNVTLWFAEEQAQINAADIGGNAVFTNQTGNKVTILNRTAAEINCKYGTEDSDTYRTLAAAGAFLYG